MKNKKKIKVHVVGVAPTIILRIQHNTIILHKLHLHIATLSVTYGMEVTEKQKELEGSRMADMMEVREFWSEAMRNKENALRDRLKASEMIARTSGAFLDKVEMKTIGEQTITVTIVDDDDAD